VAKWRDCVTQCQAVSPRRHTMLMAAPEVNLLTDALKPSA
jgi:hypothetical protein